MGWLFHCNTATLRKHKLPLPYSALSSDSFYFSSNTNGAPLVYKEKKKIFVVFYSENKIR